MTNSGRPPIVFKGKPSYLRSGEIQYFRVRRELWRPAIEQLREAGFNAVASYVPWIYHEPAEGLHDFDGQHGEYTDLMGFLRDCRSLDMPVMLRPGPQIYAELDGFGIPRWLGHDYPECVMRRPSGKLVKGPYYYFYSLLHPTYLAKVESWYHALINVVWPYFGDVVYAFQLDNETGMPQGNSLGNFDFNEDTIKRYREFLSVRYSGSDARLQTSWNQPSATLARAQPPRRLTNWAQATDWYEFFESLVGTYLKTLRDMASHIGAPVPFVINDLDLYLSPAAPNHKRNIAEIQGYDIYTKGSGYPSTADFPFAPAHDPERLAALVGQNSTFIAVELGTGWFDPRACVSVDATIQATLGGVAHGSQGHNFYIAHDGRDVNGSAYHFGSFIDESGSPTQRLRAAAAIHHWIEEREADILDSKPISTDILYLTYQPYSRLMPHDYLPGQVLPNPLAYLEKLGFDGWYDLLLTAGYSPQYADLQQVSEEHLQAHRVVCLPTCGWLDSASLNKLVRYVEVGGNLITFPTTVDKDEYGRTLECPLYPFSPKYRRRIGRRSVITTLVSQLFVRYLLWDRWYLRNLQPTAMQNIDSFEGLKVLLNKKLPAVNVTTPENLHLRGDYTIATFDALQDHTRTPNGDMPGVRIRLAQGSRCAGYTVLQGRGTSTVFGTLLAGSYTTGAYYQLDWSERAALRHFARRLMGELGSRPTWQSDLDMECTIRANSHSAVLVFMFNRASEQRGLVTVGLELGSIKSLDSSWAYHGSSAALVGNNSLDLILKPDDVLILQLSVNRDSLHAQKTRSEIIEVSQ